MTILSSAKEDMIQLIVDINKFKGLDELTSRLLGVLFIEPEEVSLEDLAKSTGYSMSGVSTAMKFLVSTEIVTRVKKPKTKRVYFLMKKDMLDNFTDLLLKKSSTIMQMVTEKVPIIIEKYGQDKSEKSRKELQIVENYYKQILLMKKLLEKWNSELEEIKKEVRR